MIRPIVAILAAGLAVASASCASTGTSDPADTVAEAQSLPLTSAFQGLCDARTIAASGDVEGAANLYYARSHVYLHEFTARVSTTDREGTARVLEAHQRVETGLANLTAPDIQGLVTAFSALEVTLAEVAERAGFVRPMCDGGVA